MMFEQKISFFSSFMQLDWKRASPFLRRKFKNLIIEIYMHLKKEKKVVDDNNLIKPVDSKLIQNEMLMQQVLIEDFIFYIPIFEHLIEPLDTFHYKLLYKIVEMVKIDFHYLNRIKNFEYLLLKTTEKNNQIWNRWMSFMLDCVEEDHNFRQIYFNIEFLQRMNTSIQHEFAEKFLGLNIKNLKKIEDNTLPELDYEEILVPPNYYQHLSLEVRLRLKCKMIDMFKFRKYFFFKKHLILILVTDPVDIAMEQQIINHFYSFLENEMDITVHEIAFTYLMMVKQSWKHRLAGMFNFIYKRRFKFLFKVIDGTVIVAHR